MPRGVYTRTKPGPKHASRPITVRDTKDKLADMSVNAADIINSFPTPPSADDDMMSNEVIEKLKSQVALLTRENDAIRTELLYAYRRLVEKI